VTTAPLTVDHSVRMFNGDRMLLGGDPTQLLTLRPAAAGWPARLAGGDRAVSGLGRMLVQRGLAHPQPRPMSALPNGLVTVVVPALDRIAGLERCLAALGQEAPVLVVDDGSTDRAGVQAVAGRHGAQLLRLTENRGPAAARNAGLAATRSPLVAFVDSDCHPPGGWLRATVPHFDDPGVAAVAPRVRAELGSSLLARYAFARGPLDLGPHQASVRAGGRVTYVPTAALVVRRAAVDGDAFDEELRYGEDVDMVWRLLDRRWVVRYDPRTVVVHDAPASWGAWLARLHAYGTSAGPLSVRHGSRVAPLVLAPAATAAWVLAMSGHPVGFLLATAAPILRLRGRLTRAGLPRGESLRVATTAVVRGVVATGEGLGGAGAVLTLPVLLAGLASRRTRPAATALLLAPPVLEWARRRPHAVDPVTWSLLRLVNDLAYASGVWRGSVRCRSVVPLLPRRRGAAQPGVGSRPHSLKPSGAAGG